MSENTHKNDNSASLVEVKEQAVHEHRNWVRVTYSCNNRCIFCLDGHVPKKGHRDESNVFKDIEDGFQPGARLIVSGGEASIHPSFIKFVEHGKKLGYNWIQTISNGRMFSYKDFATQAADAGLNEVTFSMHGHNSELHDTLTGVKGGFSQALKGMINLLKDGRVVVNVDCVINGMNYTQLSDILKFYMKLGIHEFDLLQVVPFGRAWDDEYRDKMFYDVKQAFPYLNEAFKMAYKPGNFIWTNRFPVSFLEGIEELIQDPHKLFDEIRGRREEFEQYLKTGQKPHCHGERCDFCFIKNLCSHLFELREEFLSGKVDHLEIDLKDKNKRISKTYIKNEIEKSSFESITLIGENFADIKNWFDFDTQSKLRLKLSDRSDFIEAHKKDNLPESLKNSDRLILDSLDDIEYLMNTNYCLEILLYKNNIEKLLEIKDKLKKRGNVILSMPTVETLTEAENLLPDPQIFDEFQVADFTAKNVPACIFSNNEKPEKVLRTSSLDKNGNVSLFDFVSDYIKNNYNSKSNRCEECKFSSSCKGLHINTIRVFGFKQLKPIK